MRHLLAGWNHDSIVVAPQLVGELADVFSDLALHAISFKRASACFQRDAEPKVTQLVLDSKYKALRKSEQLAVVEEAFVLPIVMEPPLSAE